MHFSSTSRQESFGANDQILLNLAKVRYESEIKTLTQNSSKYSLDLHEKAVHIALEFVSGTREMSHAQKQRVKRVLDQMKPKLTDDTLFTILTDAAKLQYKNAMDAFTIRPRHIQDAQLLAEHEKIIKSAIGLVCKTYSLTQDQEQKIKINLENMLHAYQEINSRKRSSGSPAIGIDLGTTFCCLAVFRNPNEPEIIPSETGKNKTPSYVSFPSGEDDEVKEPFFGEAAKDEAINNPHGTVFDMKRMLGRQWTDPRLQRDMEFWPFEVIDEEGILKVKTPLASYTPVEITAELLKHLKGQADKFVNSEVISAVVSVPAYFNLLQRELTKKACKLAGLNVLQLVSEPTAAAVAYSLNKKHQDQRAKNCVIFDFGGGTLDVAVLTIRSNQIQVKAVGGDAHLGGQDIDNNMMEYCLQQFQDQHDIDLKNSSQSGIMEEKLKISHRLRRLKNECEKQKCFLSLTQEVTVSLDAMHGSIPLVVNISRRIFQSLNKILFERCIGAIKQVLVKSNLDKTDIDEVVMAGGSSRIPLIQEMVSKFFGGKQLCRSIDLDEAVAVGAARLAFQAESVEIPNILVQEPRVPEIEEVDDIEKDFLSEKLEKKSEATEMEEQAMKKALQFSEDACNEFRTSKSRIEAATNTNEQVKTLDKTAKIAAIEFLSDNEININNSSRNITDELEDENKNEPEKKGESSLNLPVIETKGWINATEKEPYGVGIYFSSEIVRLEIYKEGEKQQQQQPSSLDWLPLISFPGQEIKFFLRWKRGGSSFNVHNLLSEDHYFPKTVYINSKRIHLFCEEIVAIFLNKIKSEAENKFQIEIKSCVVATSAFMNTSGKQILRSALFIAGFERSTLLQSTTAIGLSYIVQNRQIQNQPLAIVHNDSSVFDIAIAEINQNSISIKNITGTPFLEKPGSSLNPINWVGKNDPKTAKLKLLKSTLKELKAKTKPWEVILAINNSYGENDELKNYVYKMKLAHKIKLFDFEEREIALGAAALDASLIVSHSVGDGGSRLSLCYTEVFPHNLNAQYKSSDGRKIVEMIGANKLMNQNEMLEAIKKLKFILLPSATFV